MANIDGPKYLGPVILDLTNVKDSLVDLPPGATKGARREQEGMDGVVAELEKSMPGHGEAADIPAHVYQRFVTTTDTLTRLRVHEISLEKLLEVCRESRAKTENDREDDISAIAKAAQETASRKRDPGIAAPFELTIKYNAQIAEKGLSTRRKNAEARAAAAQAEKKGSEPVES